MIADGFFSLTILWRSKDFRYIWQTMINAKNFGKSIDNVYSLASCVKMIYWDNEKNEKLIAERGISFEKISGIILKEDFWGEAVKGVYFG